MLAALGVLLNVVTIDVFDAVRSLILMAVLGGGYWFLRKVNGPARESYRRRGY